MAGGHGVPLRRRLTEARESSLQQIDSLASALCSSPLVFPLLGSVAWSDPLTPKLRDSLALSRARGAPDADAERLLARWERALGEAIRATRVDGTPCWVLPQDTDGSEAALAATPDPPRLAEGGLEGVVPLMAPWDVPE